MTVQTIEIEVKKHKLAQNTDATWQITFTANAEDMKGCPILDAPMGTRYLAVLVELTDDDEEAAHRKVETTARHLVGTQENLAESMEGFVKKSAKPPERWDEMPLSKQAGIRCKDERFLEWVKKNYDWFTTQTIPPWTIEEWVRQQCGIKSRAELDANEYAAKCWQALDAEYQESMGLTAEQRG